MRMTQFLVAAAIAALVLLGACKDNSDSASEGPVVLMRATVNGTSFTGTALPDTLAGHIPFEIPTPFEIHAAQSAHSIQIILYPPVPTAVPGDYPLRSGMLIISGNGYYPDSLRSLIAYSHFDDDSIVATFHATFRSSAPGDTVAITEGRFAFNPRTDQALYFSCTVNGTPIPSFVVSQSFFLNRMSMAATDGELTVYTTVSSVRGNVPGHYAFDNNTLTNAVFKLAPGFRPTADSTTYYATTGVVTVLTVDSVQTIGAAKKAAIGRALFSCIAKNFRGDSLIVTDGVYSRAGL